jgi:hypothetical protein
MRAAFVLIALCLPGAAAAAEDPFLAQRDFQQSAQAMEARQRDIFIQNELMGLDMRLRTDQALRDSAMTPAGPIRILPGSANGVAPTVGPFAEIPDARLSNSNERVRAASKTRR